MRKKITILGLLILVFASIAIGQIFLASQTDGTEENTEGSAIILDNSGNIVEPSATFNQP